MKSRLVYPAIDLPPEGFGVSLSPGPDTSPARHGRRFARHGTADDFGSVLSFSLGAGSTL
jgi:hypothetical protein